MQHGSYRIINRGGSSALPILAWVAAALFCATPALGQRPFLMDDPFYRDETAQRNFFDGLALTGRFYYRPAGTLTNSESPLLSTISPSNALEIQDAAATASQTGSMALAFHLDYQLAPQLDLTAIFNAVGGSPGSSLTLSWISLKRYWFANGTDFALRLAFDPRPSADSGTLGLRQLDLAGLLHASIRRNVSVDMLAGVRSARIGFERLVNVGTSYPSLVQAGTPQALYSDITYTLASGSEIHLLIQTNFHFSKSGSHIFAAALFEGGRYDIEEHFLRRVVNGDVDREVTEYVGHVFWLRMGFRWNRPSYQVAPFISTPMGLWKAGDDHLDGQGRLLSSLGVSLTLR